MLSQATLFSRKELASTFLSPTTRCSALGEEACSDKSAVQSLAPNEALRFLEEKQKTLQRWHDSVSSLYHDAFNLSGRVVDLPTEKQNFAELRRVNQTSTGMSIFLNALLRDEEPLPCSQTKDAEKLRILKKTRQDYQRDNRTLASSLSVQFESLTGSIDDAVQRLKELMTLNPLNEPCEQMASRREALIQAIEAEKQKNMTLLSEIQEIDAEGKHFEEAMQKETSEIGVLKETIQRRQQDTRSRQECREQERRRMQQRLGEVEKMGQLLVKIGGCEIEGAANNPLTLKLRTDVQCPTMAPGRETSRRFEHQLTLELNPTLLTVRSARLVPHEITRLESVITGHSLSSAVSHVRSLLFLALSRRAHLEALSDYQFVGIEGEDGVWRVVLPNGMAAEILLPRNWPFGPKAEIRLLDVQGPSTSICIRPAMAKIQELCFTDLDTLLRSLCQELDVLSGIS